MKILLNNFILKHEEQYIFEIDKFEINENEFQLIGLNGIGKSSFLKVLYKLNENYSGEVILNGVNLKNYSKSEIRKKISFMSQKFELFENLTVKENLKTLTDNYNKTKELVIELNEKIILDKKISELSGGQKQVINFCIEFSKNSEILFLDEIFNHLDKNVVEKVVKKIQEDKREKVLISHKDKINFDIKYLIEERRIKYVK